ncbi:hypothetical protein SAMN05216567_11293 [Variovorax sp. OK605]|jgi:hypothetical protein|uniref:hypothetical protein n=1 Tax=unclassified Variovorax TaxID=663243 RepID=UPI0008CCD575|nr:MULTISPECIES: hypothetical protein [unclassified Variovorax]SEK16764.1 hypothetical protein SAMN05518853_13022 [Variovorax sp. OK202]SFE58556.1 hypothetical protein SAMN05444746_12922 [Variovorax sp. OK212]SFQ21778.1 hypothetical protein SAMN05216567_11293 [Variovorax sp. OK605]
MSSQAWVETIYIAPGHPDCRVYAMPYPMRPNQRPSDMLPKDQMDWREVAKLGSAQELVYIEPGYADLAANLVGQESGRHFQVTRHAG